MENFEQQSEQQMGEFSGEQTSPKREVIRVVLLVALLGALAGGAYLLHSFYKGDQAVQADLFEDLTGQVHFTAAKTAQGKAAGLYTLDASSSQVATETSKSVVNYTAILSPAGDRVAYFEAPLDLETDFPFMYSTRLKLVVEDRATGSRTVTETPDLSGARLPQWSPDGRYVAYSGLTVGEEFNHPDNWRVVVHDTQAETPDHIVSTGVYPQWSPSGESLLVLKGDGLHIQPLTASSSQRVLNIPYNAFGVSTTFGLSDDKALLAVSDAEQRSIFFYNVQWNPFQLEERTVISYAPHKLMYWPIFSPDASYMAMLSAEWGAQNEIIGIPSILVFELENFSHKEVASLAEFDPSLFFLTDWQ